MNSYREDLFVVRTWWEPGVPPVWRATLRDRSGLTRSFASPEALVAFLFSSRSAPAQGFPPQREPGG